MDIQAYIQTVLEEDYDNADDKQEWIDKMLESDSILYDHVKSILADSKWYDLPEPLSDSIIYTIDFPLLREDLQEYCANNP